MYLRKLVYGDIFSSEAKFTYFSTVSFRLTFCVYPYSLKYIKDDESEKCLTRNEAKQL